MGQRKTRKETIGEIEHPIQCEASGMLYKNLLSMMTLFDGLLDTETRK
jgi:hypothetical protein